MKSLGVSCLFFLCVFAVVLTEHLVLGTLSLPQDLTRLRIDRAAKGVTVVLNVANDPSVSVPTISAYVNGEEDDQVMLVTNESNEQEVTSTVRLERNRQSSTTSSTRGSRRSTTGYRRANSKHSHNTHDSAGSSLQLQKGMLLLLGTLWSQSGNLNQRTRVLAWCGLLGALWNLPSASAQSDQIVRLEVRLPIGWNVEELPFLPSEIVLRGRSVLHFFFGTRASRTGSPTITSWSDPTSSASSEPSSSSSNTVTATPTSTQSSTVTTTPTSTPSSSVTVTNTPCPTRPRGSSGGSSGSRSTGIAWCNEEEDEEEEDEFEF